jgi:hypothetical protein
MGKIKIKMRKFSFDEQNFGISDLSRSNDYALLKKKELP